MLFLEFFAANIRDSHAQRAYSRPRPAPDRVAADQQVCDPVALCDTIETVDWPRLAQALAREMERSGRRPPYLIEVNTGEEPQKSGFFPPRPMTSSSRAATGSACRSRA